MGKELRKKPDKDDVASLAELGGELYQNLRSLAVKYNQPVSIVCEVTVHPSGEVVLKKVSMVTENV